MFVWSAPVRTLHWAMALAVPALAGSGWMLAEAQACAGARVAELHRNVGYLLLAALAARLYLLLFGRGPEHWRDFVPWPPQHRAALGVLRMYLTLGRGPLPGYYAHNPLWGPVYLAFYAFLAVQGATGLAGLGSLHLAGFAAVTVFCVAHVLTVFLHDWKGTGSDVSAMINGHRTFTTPRPDAFRGVGVHAVPVEALLRRPPTSGL